ncbi:hypothetical protein ES319_D06G212900v1, partial [Gossypium barbadense]
ICSFSNTSGPVIDTPPIQRRLENYFLFSFPFSALIDFCFFFHRYYRSVLISSAFITNPQHCLHRRPISATSDECCSVQLSDGDGSFNDTGIESFIKEVKLHECGLSYAVVSIMGPQSSVATPKQIRELMQVDGLTNDEVKSHLQKYQLHTRRLPATTTTTTHANQSGLVLGGGHAWMCQDQFGESSKGSSSQWVPLKVLSS